MNPALSVIVPVHDRGDLLARCLTSLATWNGPGGLEILVVDDGSSDPAVHQLRERPTPGTRWVVRTKAGGFADAVNHGLDEARGEILLLLNSDTEVRPGGDVALARAIANGATGRTEKIGGIAARLVYPDGRAQWSGGREPTLPWLFALASGLGRGARRGAPSGSGGGRVDWAPAAALALTRAAWSAVGPFDTRFRHYAQDLDYGHRLRLAGFRLLVEPAFEVVHHLGGSAGEAASAGQRLDLLWSDLVAWHAKARGPRAAAAAARTLRWGARWRLWRLPRRDAEEERPRIERALAALADLAATVQQAAASPEPPRRSR